MTRPTPREYEAHLLSVLGKLTDLKAGRAVPMEATFAPVCALMGVREDEFGVSAHGALHTHRAISIAMRQMRDRGLTDYVKKGRWALTSLGVNTLRAPETSESDVVGLRPRARRDDPYSDPYVRALAVVRTPCFGGWSSTNSVCAGCRLAVPCAEARWIRKAEISAEIQAEEAAAAAAKAVKQQKKLKHDSSVDELIAAIQHTAPDASRTKGAAGKYRPVPGEEVVSSAVQLDSVCLHCGGAIPARSGALWIKGRGMFHVACVGMLDSNGYTSR